MADDVDMKIEVTPATAAATTTGTNDGSDVAMADVLSSLQSTTDSTSATAVSAEGDTIASGIGPTTGSATAPPATSTAPVGRSSNPLAARLRMNAFFKAHGIPSTDAHAQIYQEFVKEHPGPDEYPPITAFNTKTLIPNTNNLPTNEPTIPSSTNTNGTSPSHATTAPMDDLLGGVAGGVSPLQPSSTSPSSSVPVTSEAIARVRKMCSNLYAFTNSDSHFRHQKSIDVQGVLTQLKGGPYGPMPQLQTSLMYAPDRTAYQQQAAQQPGGGSTTQPQRSTSGNSQHSLSSQPGHPYDPRRQPPYPDPNQQRGGGAQKRKEMDGGPSSMQPPPSHIAQSGKYRKETQETSAAEMRTQKALEQQAANLGTPITYNASLAPPSSASQRYPSPSNQPHQPQPIIARSRPPPSHANHIGGYAPSNLMAPFQPPMPSPPIGNQSNAPALIQQWYNQKQRQGDAHHFYLDSKDLISKITAIAADHDLSVPTGDRGLTVIELLTLSTEGFLKTLLQSAQHISRRRQDVAKGYLPIQVVNEPKKELDELRRQAEERKLRWAKHRERAEDDLKRKAEKAQAAAQAATNAERRELEMKNAEAAALEAKHAAAVAEAERLAREATNTNGAGGTGGAQPAAVEDDYILSLIGGSSTKDNGANSATAPPPTVAAPSFLPPSALPPSTRSFLPSSSLTSSGSGKLAPTIVLSDLLTVLEAHPQLRKSSRLYQGYTLLENKRPESTTTTTTSSSTLSAFTPSPAPPPPPPPPSNPIISLQQSAPPPTLLPLPRLDMTPSPSLSPPPTMADFLSNPMLVNTAAALLGGANVFHANAFLPKLG